MVVFVVGGNFAIGSALMEEAGLDLQQARNHIWMVDSHGLVTKQRLASLAHHKQALARDDAVMGAWGVPTSPMGDLLTVIKKVHPSVLIGVTGQCGIFDETIIKTMHQYVARPVIFALSNPTSKAECTAEQAYTWTAGAAVFASGSPFASVNYNGRVFVPGQCNNMYIFPGMGLGAVACKAKTISDRMFYVAACTLASEVSDDMLAVGQLYPDLRRIRDISTKIAVAVCEVAFTTGYAGILRPDDLQAFIRDRMYQPHYVPYQAA